MGTSILTTGAGRTQSNGGDGGPIPTDGLVLWLDSNDPASYPGTGIFWYDLSGNGNLFKLLQPSAFNISPNGNYMNFYGTSSSAYKDSGLIGPDAQGTAIYIGRPVNNSSDWRTSFTGQVGDPGLKWYGLIGPPPSGNNFGVYDIVTDQFYDSGFDINNITNVFTDFNVYVHRLATSSPYWQLSINNGTVLASLTNPATSFTTGFFAIGALDVDAVNPQGFGDIGVFLYYNKNLTNEEIDQIVAYYSTIYQIGGTTTTSSSSTSEEPTSSSSSTSEEPTSSSSSTSEEPTSSSSSTSEEPTSSSSSTSVTSSSSTTAGGFSPLSLPNLVSWYDPSDSGTVWQNTSGTVPSGNNDPIARLDDKSGNANTLLQGTGSAQPLYNTAVQNGLNVIYNWIDQGLISGTLSSSLNTWQVYVVVQRLVASADEIPWCLYKSSASGTCSWVAPYNATNTNMYALVFNDACSYEGGGATANNGNFNIWSFSFDGSNVVGSLNGVEVINLPITGTITGLDTFCLGIRKELIQSWRGYIGETVITDGLTSAQDDYAMTAYLGNKWNISYPTTTTSSSSSSSSSSTTTPNPTMISGLSIWLDAADPTTLWQDTGAITPASSNGDPVALWQDRSGNGNNAEQVTSGLEPTLSTASLNGLNTLAFASDWLLGSIATTLHAQKSMYMVFKTAAASQNTLVDMRKATSGSDEDLWYVSSGLVATGYEILSRDHGAPSSLNILTDGGPDNNYHLMIASYDGTDVKLEVSGFTPVSSAKTWSTPTDLNYYKLGEIFGASFPLTGNIAEFVVFDHALSSGDNTIMVNYLTAKWNL